MATSNVIDFSPSLLAIINEAARLSGKQGIMEPSVDAAFYTVCRDSLNLIISGWRANNLFLWKDVFATLFLNVGQSEFLIGSGHAAKTYIETSLSAAVLTGGIITVASATGIAVGDNVGIILDSGTIHWSTASVVVGATITLVAALPSAAASGQSVFSYKTINKLGRIYDLNQVFLCNDSSGLLTPLRGLSRTDYGAAMSSAAGSINAWYFQRANSGSQTLYFDRPASAATRVRLDVKEQLQIFTNGSDEADFPAEWLDAVTWALAERIAFMRGASLDIIAALNDKARVAMYTARGNDVSYHAAQNGLGTMGFKY